MYRCKPPRQRGGSIAALPFFERCTAGGSPICGNILRWGYRGPKAAIPPHAGRQVKNSPESRSTQGTFFFAPRYCRGQKLDPT
jgi:hypothetical protein